MATKKTTSTKKTKLTDLDTTLKELREDEAMFEGQDFYVHEYRHGYIDIRFHDQRADIEFRPDGSLIERDPTGKEINV